MIPGGLGGAKDNPYLEIKDGPAKIVAPSLTENSIAISSRSTPIFNVDNKFTAPNYTALNVYKIEEPREKFGTETKAEDIARRFGLSEVEPLRSSTGRGDEKGLLTWRQGSKLLKYDKLRQEIDYNNTFAIPKGTENQFINDETTLRDQAQKLIAQLALNRSKLDFSTMRIEYLNRKGSSSFNVATSPNTADYISVRVYRRLEAASLKKDDEGNVLEQYRGKYEAIAANVVTQNYQTAPLELILAGDNGRELRIEQVYSAKFIDWSIEAQPILYQSITPEEAWEQVKQGKGSLQEVVEFGFDRLQTGRTPDKEILSFTANYQEVELAYIEHSEWKGYFYPIYIFKGRAKLSNSPNQDNANFIFYAYAIKQE